MRVIIIEDEKLTSDKLTRQLCKLYSNTEVICQLTSVSDSVEWFNHNSMPDLIFMDIKLSDGISFQIFEEIDITCPIIFTTAYDEFALRAFEVSSIDYLLKPIDDAALMRAMNKYALLSSKHNNNYIASVKLLVDRYYLGIADQYPYSILVDNKDKLIPIKSSEIAYLYFSNKTIDIVTMNGSKYKTSGSLESYLELLNPNEFYRANRQFVIAKKAVKDLTLWFNCRLIVNLCVNTPERIVISRTNSSDFKEWLINGTLR